MNDNDILLERIKSGDKSAEESFIKNNMKLVWSLAGRFLNFGYEKEDLYQIGAIGLINAVHKFDLSFGVKFSTYAVPVILGEIKRFLRDDGMIKISRTLKENSLKGKRIAEALRGSLGREPTIEEISKESGIKVEDLIEAFEALQPVETITPTDRDGNECELNICEEQDSEEKIMNKVLVENMLERITSKEKQILILRYFKGKTQSQTAEVIGVSQVQISRIEKAVLKKIKNEYSV